MGITNRRQAKFISWSIYFKSFQSFQQAWQLIKYLLKQPLTAAKNKFSSDQIPNQALCEYGGWPFEYHNLFCRFNSEKTKNTFCAVFPNLYLHY